MLAWARAAILKGIEKGREQGQREGTTIPQLAGALRNAPRISLPTILSSDSAAVLSQWLLAEDRQTARVPVAQDNLYLHD